MKKVFYIMFIVPLIMISCETIPDAHFSVDKIEAYIGEEIIFTNQSYNAVWYEWDFGDGFVTNATHPIYTYNSTGLFEVVLTAESKSGNISQAFKTINVLAPTMLEIEVLDWELEYPVEGANVRLYPSLYDWDNETNMVIEGNTNASGKVLFTGLRQAVYYVDVWEANHNNFDFRGFDNDYYITTDMLVPNQVNTFVAWVDYTGTKGMAERDRSVVIHKPDRKPKAK